MALSGYVFCLLALGFRYINVSEAVSLTLKPGSIISPTYVEKGKSLTLNVTYDYNGSEVVEVLWIRDVIVRLYRKRNPGAEKQFVSRASIKGNASLVLVNTTLNDNGTYEVQARADDVILTQKKEFLVVIQVKSIAKITCAFVNITEGENFTCICSGVGGSPPPTAYWLKDNNVRAMGYRSALLDIRNISKKDTGTYTCRVKSGTLPDEQRVDITVFDKPVVNVTCNTSVFIKEGKNFSCKCSGNDGSPPASVMWLKDNKKFATVDNILKLPNIDKRNNGTYVCRVQSGNLKKEERADVTVFYKPRNISFSSNEPNNMVTSGYTVIITCKADAYPEASYSISFNGSQLLTDAVDGVYNISSVNDSHAGKYTCVAKNIIGNVSTHFVLTVRDRPTMISFTSNVTNIAKPGDNVKLTCVAIDGYPKPTYQIMFKGKTVSSTGVLIIENADSDDIGTYTCFASNGAGSIQKSLVFNVTGSGPGTPAPSTTPVPSTTPAPSTTPRRNTIASTEKSISDKNCGGTEWYIVVIAVFCGIGIGIVFCYTVMWLCRRRREKRDHPKPSETRRAPETHDNPSVYQELDLQRMNNEDNYQSLRKTSRPVGHQEPTAEAAESSYQELDKVRGNNDDNNYQSLNRV